MFDKLKKKLRGNRAKYQKYAPYLAVFRNSLIVLSRTILGYDPELAVFSAFDFASYNDNPRYISEKLHSIRPQTKIVWLFKDVDAAKKRFDIPDYVLCRNSISVRGVVDLARARVVVDNFSKRFYLKFPGRGQIYFQAWHGDRAFKKIGYDCSHHHINLREEFAAVSMTGSDYGDMQYRSAFHYRGRLMRAGYPRNDILLRDDPAEKAAIRKKIGLSPDEGILLYAPTYRDWNNAVGVKEEIRLNLPRTLDAFERATGRKWRVLTRAHYLSMGLDEKKGDPRILQMSAYPEMAELMLISDALITDYSSCAGDFALTERPIFLFQNDLKNYLELNRELYFDMKDSPYLVAATQEEMEALIENTTPEQAKANCRAILDFYVTCETGRAAETAAEYIAGKLGRENRKADPNEGLSEEDLKRPIAGSGRWKIAYFED